MDNSELLKGFGPSPKYEWLFWPIMITMGALFLGSGLYLKSIKVIPSIQFKAQSGPMRAQFIMKEQKKAQPPPPRKKAETVEKNSEAPVDLSNKPVLAQKQDDIQETTPGTSTTSAPVRRVYGLRRVFSTGFGASGSGSDAVIGKLGNTLNAEVDTVTPTKEELKGEVVSITTVTQAPKVKSAIKPEYTKEMIDNRIEGVIRAKLLIDIDGKVKKVILYNDLGYGSREKALEAFSKLEFEPAMAGDTPRAVWIQFSFRFELIN